MKIIKTFFLLATVLIVFSCDKDDTIFGSGNLITEARTVSSFTKIKSEGVIDVTVTQGASQAVNITADDNVIGKVKTRLKNNELQLYLDSDTNYSGITVRADIVVTQLNGIKNFGTGKMDLNSISSNTSFYIENEGTGNIEIDGVASSLSIHNQGSGDISGFDFLVKDCTIDIIGSGDVKISCSDNLDVNIQGSGDVYYKGTPSISTSISGSGKVINAN